MAMAATMTVAVFLIMFLIMFMSMSIETVSKAMTMVILLVTVSMPMVMTVSVVVSVPIMTMTPLILVVHVILIMNSVVVADLTFLFRLIVHHSSVRHWLVSLRIRLSLIIFRLQQLLQNRRSNNVLSFFNYWWRWSGHWFYAERLRFLNLVNVDLLSLLEVCFLLSLLHLCRGLGLNLGHHSLDLLLHPGLLLLHMLGSDFFNFRLVFPSSSSDCCLTPKS